MVGFGKKSNLKHFFTQSGVQETNCYEISVRILTLTINDMPFLKIMELKRIR